jgi:hypothetical protein
MNYAKTAFSAEIFAGAIISVVQYLAPLRYVNWGQLACGFPVLASQKMIQTFLWLTLTKISYDLHCKSVLAAHLDITPVKVQAHLQLDFSSC